MTLGLSVEELSSLYQERFISIHNHRNKNKHENEAGLVSIDYSKTEAAMLSTTEIRILAASEAMLEVVAANNLRIELQLKDKGL